jgi:hypothetical protein
MYHALLSEHQEHEHPPVDLSIPLPSIALPWDGLFGMLTGQPCLT